VIVNPLICAGLRCLFHRYPAARRWRWAGRRFSIPQGSQFTAQEYTGRLEEAGIAVSRDGRGRALDNVFVERLWRHVKYEYIYIKEYERVSELESGLAAYFWFSDEERPHQSLGYRTSAEVYRAGSRGG
jgi:putative transposase